MLLSFIVITVQSSEVHSILVSTFLIRDSTAGLVRRYTIQSNGRTDRSSATAYTRQATQP